MVDWRLEQVRIRCGMENKVAVAPRGLSGGLVLWWKEEVALDVLYKSDNMIHVRASCSSDDIPAFLTFVYGPTDENYPWWLGTG